jgi:hypothetical protein
MDPMKLSFTAMDVQARCPRYNHYNTELELESLAPSLGKEFGSAGHAGLGALYSTKSLEEALKAAEKVWKPWEGQDVDKNGKPGVRTLIKLKEILTAYKEQFYDQEKWEDTGGEKLQQIELLHPPECFQEFLSLVGSPNLQLIYRYKIDRTGLSGGVKAVQEWKFLKPFMGKEFITEPNNQVVGYLKGEKATKAVVTVMDVMASSVKGMVKGKAKDAEWRSIFKRDPVFYEPWVFEEWEKDVWGWALSILTCRMSGYWPKNAPGACDNYGGCIFKMLCCAPPEQRETMIELGFRKKKPHEEEVIV